MNQCPSCKKKLSLQRLYRNAYYQCLICFHTGFAQTTFETLVPSLVSALKPHFASEGPGHGAPCFLCGTQMHEMRLSSGTPLRNENLKLYPSWRHWYDHHTKGHASVSHCGNCGAYWMNVRAVCMLPVDWQSLESEYQEARRTLQKESPAPRFPWTPDWG